MAKLAVQFEDLRSQSQAVQQGSTEVNETLARLTAQISDLASRWEGGTSEAFQQRWQDWRTSAQNVEQAMQEMGVFLGRAADAYEETENSLRSATGR